MYNKQILPKKVVKNIDDLKFKKGMVPNFSMETDIKSIVTFEFHGVSLSTLQLGLETLI